MNYFPPEAAVSAAADAGSSEFFPPIALPRVSVIVTCFNYAPYVAQALDSVVAQTYQELNCVIVDDASTDDSVAVIERWLAATNDPRFRLIQNTTNRGQMASFAAGLAASDSEFVAFLDADDIWFPQFLQRHIEVHLNRIQYAGVSSSDLVQVDRDRRAVSGMTKWTDFEPAVLKEKVFSFKGDDLPLFDLSKMKLKLTYAAEVKYYFPGLDWRGSVSSGTIFRRPLLELVIPPEPERISICADYYIMVLCHYFTGTLVIEDALGGYRRHGKNQFSSLPVLGGNSAFSRSDAHLRNLRTTIEVMLGHLLDSQDAFCLAFSSRRVRPLVRFLFRQCLSEGLPVRHPRLSAMLGRGQVVRDRIRAKIKFLRRW
jgi:glycosyltransferase involved in cell wall biosynthesis